MPTHRKLGKRATAGIALAVAVLLSVASALSAHDLFLRADRYFVAPNSTVLLRVLNGTFSKSENAVTNDRLRDLSFVTPAGARQLDTSAWVSHGDTSTLSIRLGEAGTYAVGASLLPRELGLSAKEFNEYLTSDGIPDVLADRRRTGQLDRPSRERYSKHVKAILQVGDTKSDGFGAVLGYPAELVALDNPYALAVGGTMRVRALVDGAPAAQQLVIAGGRNASGSRLTEQKVRTDSTGVARIRIATRGVFYVKFIHMVRAVNEPSIDYESKWATLTFAVR